ncbi:hypothetical protein [Adlercreutzia murintestinalis]|uniref:hypothetical protein n=1 Tax=Adlercreutzia murintestinalis TaxID=2941325 RepID=UPI0020407F45|nr:hypothetical protein [Adlercreutzia murintestinalis]
MIKSLQSLRALAIIAIMLSHCSFLGSWLPSGLGTLGVSLFISLSGFLTFLSSKGKAVCSASPLCSWSHPPIALRPPPRHSALPSLASRILRCKTLVYLGDISMQLFLIHQLVIKYLKSVLSLTLNPLLSLALCFGISIMIDATVKNASAGYSLAKPR